jgi:hypothetical protein
MSRHSISDQPMTSAERQARYRARKASERDLAAREMLYGARLNLGKLCHHLARQGDPRALGAVLAGLDGPPLPIAVLAEAAAWLTGFAESYRVALQASAAPTPRPDPLAKHLWPTPQRTPTP